MRIPDKWIVIGFLLFASGFALGGYFPHAECKPCTIWDLPADTALLKQLPDHLQPPIQRLYFTRDVYRKKLDSVLAVYDVRVCWKEPSLLTDPKLGHWPDMSNMAKLQPTMRCWEEGRGSLQ
jgi:hypothetical protein